MATMRWSPRWAVAGGLNEGFDDAPVLTAGPDVKFALDGVSSGLAKTLRSWSAGATIDPTEPEGSELRDLLVGLGAIVAEVAEKPTIGIIGSEPTGFAETMADLGQPDSTAAPDLSVVFRNEARWPDAPNHQHLGVDLTHYHTVVLGPFVIPGASSCLDCLTRQTERSWGLDAVPAEPAIGRWGNILAELVAIQIENAVAGEVPLLNATMTWDLRSGQSTRQDLLRAPECGGPCRAPSADRIALPWLAS